MNKFGLALVATVLSVQPFLLSVALAETNPAAAPATVKTDDDREICKSDKPTGTRVSAKKVCKTKAEWEEYNRQQRADAQRIQGNALDQKIQTGGN